MINSSREIGNGQEIEASEGQEVGTGETIDETRGSAGREALDQVLGLSERFFGRAPSLIGD